MIPYSTCTEGIRPDRGTAHRCPGIRGRGFWFWMFVLVLPFGFTALIAYWYYRRSGMATGYVPSLLSLMPCIDSVLEGQFAFLEETVDTVIRANPGSWPHSLLFLGSYLALQASHGSGSPRVLKLWVVACDLEGVIETFLSMKMPKS